MMRPLILGLAAALAFQPWLAHGATTAQYGRWTYREDTDAFTDKLKASVFLVGKGGGISLKCDEAGPRSIYARFVSEEFLGEARLREFRWRFDDAAPDGDTWIYSDNYAEMSDFPRAMIFLNQVARATKLTVRALTYRGRTVEAAFDLDGAPEAIARLTKTCLGS
jgi:hypothetical protein